MPRFFQLAGLILILALPNAGFAQGSEFAFGNTAQDSSLPIEVAADHLAVDQNDGTAVFSGNVMIEQGEMRLTADRVLVIYLENQSGIESLEATGSVTLVSGSDAAEAQKAQYTLESGLIKMNGNVLLVQGSTTLAAETMTVNTKTGTAQMSGRVKTVLQPQGEN